MFLASNAFQAGSLAASQPGLTIVDPLVAGALGVVLFGESLRHNPLILSGEVLAVAVVIASVIMLSQSPLVQDEDASESEVAPARPVPTASTGDRVPIVRLPRAMRRPLAILANDKGSAPESQVPVASERKARRPGARSETGSTASPEGSGKRLVNQL
jgi:fructose-specific component phosphotransferase system IIB-like protein